MAASIIEIPSPPQLPLLGNLLQLPRSRLAQHLLETSRHYDGIFHLNFAGIRVVFVHSAELVAEVCDETRFRKVVRPPLSLLRELAKDGLFTAHSDEPNWGKAHRILLPAFGHRAMKGYFDYMVEVAMQLARKWESAPGRDILVADDMTRLTLDTISLAGFDYRFNSFAKEELHPFLEAMVRVLSDALQQLTRLPIQNRFMSHKRNRDDIALMNALVDEVIRHRREHPVESNDLLNLMLNAVDPETGEKLDDINIRYQVITFLIAGHETTSGLLTFALYLLLRHPHVLAQAYAEVDRVLPGDATPTYADLSKLNVIERVLKETLRLWPTAPAFGVAPYETTIIGGKYGIKKDQFVSVVIPALHRDKAVWKDPESFDIDRFLPDAETKLPRHAYKPFGNGQRACIGRQFALTEAKLALAVILQRFAISDPHDYRFRIKETLTLKPEDFYIRAKRRKPHERLRIDTPAAPVVEAKSPESVAIEGAGTPFTVLYGTSLGTSRDVAEHLAEQAHHLGFAVKTAAIDDYANELPSEGVLVIVTATYNGKAPDSARQFAARIERGELHSTPLPKLRYAVLGCGNSQWPMFQAFPSLVADALKETGASEILPRAEADGNADFDGAIERWSEQLWRVLGGSGDNARAEQPRITVTYRSEVQTRAAVLPTMAHTLTVQDNEELVRDPTGLWDFAMEAPRSSARHITLALPADLRYETGDHLGVYPRNRAELVQAVAKRLDLHLGAVVVLNGDASRVRHLPLGQPLTVEQLLSDFVELQDPVVRKDIRKLLPHTPCPHTRAQLERLLNDDAASIAQFQKEITEKRVTLYDLLARFPAIQLPLDAFVDLCSPMRPRFYSISSSPLAETKQVALTVGAVCGHAWSGSGEYKGVASTYLCGLKPGDQVLAFVRKPEPPFAPPEDPAQPMILVGPGTGFAPFRGFLQHRIARQAQGARVGRSLLFYGCRHPEHDWFYREEMEAAQNKDVVTLHVAFSALAGHPYRFVQDALWAQRASVWQLLHANATVYVCGDGRHMAPAVRDTLIRIHMECGNSTHDDSSAWLQALIKNGHYRQDVFGD